MKFRSSQFTQTHYNLELQEIYLKKFLSAAAVQNPPPSSQQPDEPASSHIDCPSASASRKPSQPQASSRASSSKSQSVVKSSSSAAAVASSSESVSARPSVNTNTMRNKTTSSSATPSNLNSVSGLNNLGNSCFFNAVLQNIAQTPYLLDLLKENFGTQYKQFLIRQNSEFDSELDDEDEPCEETRSSRASSVVKTATAAGDSDSSDADQQANGDGDESGQSKSSPRSMRLADLSITVKEASGPLTRQLFETVKSMTAARTTVNPSPLFGQICKKIPSYKGFQQQDSHELLINLLDSIKTEELKRRQAGILEALRINPKALDDISKRRIKRYGRLASYTFVDRLFGGHLLSSVVCEECKTCSHRIEPFLDLSLPIVDESVGKQTSIMSALAQTGSNKIANVNSTFQRAKGKLKTMSKDKLAADPAAAFLKEGSADSVDSGKLSKHQLKKQKKTAKKTKRKGRGKGDDEEAEEDDKKDVDSVQAALCKLDIADTDQDAGEATEVGKNGHEAKSDQAEAGKEHDDNEDVVVSPTTLRNSHESERQSDEHSEDEEGEELDEDDDENGDVDYESRDREYKYMNAFRLEAMKRARSASEAVDDSGCTIQLCLSKFTANELLREKLSCEFCTNRLNPSHGSSSSAKSKGNSTKQQSVYTHALKQYLICELPAVLIIHLKRFQQHGYRLEKSNKHVGFSLLLDMSPYTSKMCVNLFTNSAKAAPQAQYALYGLVEHSGRLNSGHYTAYVKANPRPGFHHDQAAFLGSHRICHLKSMLKRWNGKNLAPKSMEEELMSKESQEVFCNQYTCLDNRQVDEDESPPGATSNSHDSSSQPQPQPSEDKWYYVSDTSVSEVSVAKVLKAQAYLLFYERIE